MNKPIKSKQLYELFLAHFKEILREPGVLFWGVLFPILMSLGLGVAFSKKTDTTRNIAVVEHVITKDSSSNNNSDIESFLNEHTKKNEKKENGNTIYKYTLRNEKLGNITYLFHVTDWNDAIVALKRGKLSIIIDEERNEIKYHFDPANPDAQLSYLNLTKIFNSTKHAIVENEENIEPLTVTGTRYIDFLIPGLIAMGIMMSSMWGISYNLIDKRSKKLLRRLIATPMRKSHFLIALIVVRIIMNFVEAVLLFLFSYFVFDITIQGDIGALILIFIAGNIAFAGIAVFVSSHTSNTEVGNGLINVVVLPLTVLSGIFFSYQNFPDWSLPYIKALPLTLLADGTRSIFIEGASYANIAIPFFVLMITGVVTFLVGLKIFKWY